MKILRLLLAAVSLGIALYFLWPIVYSTSVTFYLCDEKGDPVVGKDVIFVRKEYEVVLAIKITDKQGRVTLQNVPFGTLSILERPARPQDKREVTISREPRKLVEVNLVPGTFNHEIGSPCNKSQR